MSEPFLGVEAVHAGRITRGQLRSRFTAVHPGVYVPRHAARTLLMNTVAAWLWTGRRGVIAGRAAAALHGARWIDDVTPIELITPHTRRRQGVIVRRARAALNLMDAGAQSPKETWLRLLVFDAGYERPQTQLRVTDGFNTAFIDLGWEEPKIGLDYEGDHHRSERRTYVNDIGRYSMIDGQGWIDLRIVVEHSRAFILRRLRDAFLQRGLQLPPSSASGW